MGKYRKESLVFHIYDSAKDKDFELATDLKLFEYYIGKELNLDRIQKGHKRKYKSFISFLNRNYLSETAKFGHHKWNYYQSFCDDDFSITTNSLENVNGRFIIGRFIIE